MTAAREFPDAPRVGVGAVVLDGERVLLARRGRAPSAGKWSIPGGLVDLGERLEEAAIREVEEESGLRVRLLGLCGVIDRVVREQDAIRYHYVIVDYVAECVGGRLEAGSDAAEVRWVAVGELAQYETTDGLKDMIDKARAIQRAMSTQPGGPNR
ncbi:MAG TPA: NUDIX hydrolase [Candidatus Bathyarchaeia archaeon]|nr:NUDIX hydrolase [Candidatus Bathyarchaeia archaeon]